MSATLTEPRTRKRRGALGPTYNAEEVGEPLDLLVTLISPGGVEFDLTRRVVGGVGTLNEILEVELTTIGHSDIDLEVDDADGLVADFLGLPDPSDVWTVIIERETGKRRPKYVRLFGGILDLPWSLEHDRSDKIVSFDVFAFSKELEFASAEGIVRDLSAIRLSNSAATDQATVTAGAISDLSVGDQIVVGIGTGPIGGREEKTITEVRDQDGIIVVDSDWDTAHTTEPIITETPFHRFATPTFLVGELFDAAGIVDREINLPAFLFPIPAAMNINAFPVAEDSDTGWIPKGVTVVAGSIQFRFRGLAAVEGKWEATDLGSRWDFTGGATDHHLAGDWTAYQTTEPGTNPILVNVAAARDDGQYCWDFSRGDYYELVQNVSALELHKNGAFNETIIASGAGPTTGINDGANLEYEPSQDELWVSYRHGSSSTTQYRAAGGGAWTTFLTGSGFVNYFRLRALGPASLLWVSSVLTPASTGFWWRIIDPATHAYQDGPAPEVPQAVLDLPLASGATILATWSLRAMSASNFGTPKFVVGMLNLLDDTTTDGVARFGSWLISWDLTRNFKFLGMTRIKDTSISTIEQFGSGAPIATIFQGSTRPAYVAFAAETVAPDNGTGRLFVGALTPPVVPYADFDGKDVAEALQDLAVGVGCYARVDENRVGRFVPRAPLEQSGIAPSLPEPIEQRSLPVWESYRSNVRVLGTRQSFDPSRDDDFAVVLGPPGDSSRVLSLESLVITTESVAEAVARYFFDYVAKIRRQEDVTIPETGTLFRPFDQVELGGVRFMVLEASTDLEGREQDLVLIEIVN